MFNLLRASGQKISAMFAGVGIVGATCALMLSASSADAVTYNFSEVTGTPNNVEDVGNQLFVNVLSHSATQVSFTFANSVGIASSITDIYFDDHANSLFAVPIAEIIESAGVAFTAPATPGDFPGGGSFTVTTGLSADSDSPASQNGVNALGEYVTLILNLTTPNTFDAVLAALGTGDLSIGLHVQAIGVDDGSDSYINNTTPGGGGVFPPIPLPAGLPLMLTALGVVAVVRRKSRKTV